MLYTVHFRFYIVEGLARTNDTAFLPALPYHIAMGIVNDARQHFPRLGTAADIWLTAI